MPKTKHDLKVKSFDKESYDLHKALYGFYHIQQILGDVIAEETGNDNAIVMTVVDDWKNSSIQFSDVIRFYGGFNGFNPLVVAALDNIRTDYGYFAHSTSTWNDHRRLMDLCETIDAVTPLLENIHDTLMARDARPGATRNTGNIRDEVRRSIDECEKRDDGWTFLSDVGNDLSKKGVRYDGKLSDICRGLGFEMRTERTPGTDPSILVHLIR